MSKLSDDIQFDKLYTSDELPNENYHEIDCASRSVLFDIAKGKALSAVRHAMQAENIASPAMQVGTALHTLVLQPENFDAEVVEALDLPRRSNADKATHEQFAETHAGKLIISPDDMQRVKSMRDAIIDHPAANFLLSQDGPREVSALWTDKEHPLQCKARPDLTIERLRALVDVKTTSDASPSEFARSAANFGYHAQAAWYLRGMNALDIDVHRFIFICVESKAPYAVAVYRLDDEAIEKGRELMRAAMPVLASAYESGNWHGYSDEIEDLNLPSWALK
jgi:hypothetical protein